MLQRKPKNDTNNTLKLLAVGAAAAATAGLIVGILSKPKKPQTTAEKIKQSGTDKAKEIEGQLSTAQKELAKVMTSARAAAKDTASKKELLDVLKTAKDSKDKATEVLSALKNGKVDDKDLKKAIKDARHSIEHLKDFLKK